MTKDNQRTGVWWKEEVVRTSEVGILTEGRDGMGTKWPEKKECVLRKCSCFLQKQKSKYVPIEGISYRYLDCGGDHG